MNDLFRQGWGRAAVWCCLGCSAAALAVGFLLGQAFAERAPPEPPIHWSGPGLWPAGEVRGARQAPNALPAELEV